METFVISAVAALAAIGAAVGAVALTPLFYRRQMREEVHRERDVRTDQVRRQVYEDYLTAFVRMFEAAGKNNNPGMKKVLAAQWSFSAKAPLLASETVLQAVAQMRNNVQPESDNTDKSQILVDLLNIVGAMRRDFGYESTATTSELVARLWLNDLDKQPELLQRLRRLDG